MNHIMAFVLRLAYISARKHYHDRAVAMIGEVPPPGFTNEFTSALWAFADLCEAADELEKPKCRSCGATLPV